MIINIWKQYNNYVKYYNVGQVDWVSYMTLTLCAEPIGAPGKLPDRYELWSIARLNELITLYYRSNEPKLKLLKNGL